MQAGNAHSSDEELLALYKRSTDINILGMLYNRYMSMVYGVCLKYLKNREESRDAVMHIFEKLVDTLKTHEVSNFKGWLFVTSRNHCLMLLRAAKGKYFEELSFQVVESAENGHPDWEDDPELNFGKLSKCMDELNAEQQQCVRLFYMEQKCYKEITQLTGYDDNKVKSYIQNGKRNLKICMEKNG